jgi:hypothetical protein
MNLTHVLISLSVFTILAGAGCVCDSGQAVEHRETGQASRSSHEGQGSPTTSAGREKAGHEKSGPGKGVRPLADSCGAICKIISEDENQTVADGVKYTVNSYYGYSRDSSGNAIQVKIEVVMGEIDGTKIPFPDGYSGGKIELDPSVKPYASGQVRINTGFAWVRVKKVTDSPCEKPFEGQKWRHVVTRTVAGGARGTEFIVACAPDANMSVLFDRIFLIDPTGSGSTCDSVAIGWRDSCEPGKGLACESWVEATLAPSISKPQTTFTEQDCKFIKGVVDFINAKLFLNAKSPNTSHCK